MTTKKAESITGYVYGIVEEGLGILDPIADSHILAVPVEKGVPATRDLTDPPVGLREINKPEFQAIAYGNAFAAQTDEKGGFHLNIPNYQGLPLHLYVRVRRVPAPSLPEKSFPLPQPRFFDLGVYQPIRHEARHLVIAGIPTEVWAGVRERADLWVVVGKVVSTANPNGSCAQFMVTAFDADITQHDFLGETTTDENGVFRIDYPGKNFRQGTLIDVELYGGPDLYFKIQTQRGNVLLEEAPDTGFLVGRNNRGACSRVDLKVNKPGEPAAASAVWTSIGRCFTVPDTSGLNDFGPGGLACGFALHGTIRLKGHINGASDRKKRLLYRFLLTDTTAGNNRPPIVAGNFTRVVGVGADNELFAPSKVGWMVRDQPYQIVPIVAEPVDLDNEGWLDIQKSILRLFTAHPTLSPADIPSFTWRSSGVLLALNTKAIAPTPPPVSPPVAAGDSLPREHHINLVDLALRFEVREFGAGEKSRPPIGNGQTLNRLLVCNHQPYIHLQVEKNELGQSATLAYTIHHPLLSSARITFLNHGAASGQAFVSLIDETVPPVESFEDDQLSAARTCIGRISLPKDQNGNQPGEALIELQCHLHDGDRACPATQMRIILPT